jgi:hypothetical protein
LDPELQSDLAKYLCILTCGFLEEAIERTVLDYCTQVGDARLLSYIHGEMDRFRNPSRHEITGLLGRLDASWKSRIQVLFANNEYADALDGLLNVRHAIVHGQTATTTVTEAQAYFGRVRIIARFLLDLILPRGSVQA